MKNNILAAFLAVVAVFEVHVAICWAAEPVRPNVVLIISDDMGYSDIGPFGCKDIRTPNIDRLAKGGTLFTDAYVSGPICVPSRMGIMTGRYQQRWGVYGNNDGYTPEGLKRTAAETTIAEVFQKAGYVTALIGKWHLSGNGAILKAPPETLPEKNGFDEVTVIPGGMSAYKEAMLYCGGGRLEKAPEYLTDHFGKLSVDFIQRNKSKPFLLFLTFNAVHAPLQAVDADVAKCGEIPVVDRRTYAGMMTALDRNVGRVLDAITAAGVEQNTIVVFLSDNGGPAHDAAVHSRNMAENGPFRGHKFDVLEGGIRTPMMMKWPGRIPAGKKFSGLSSSMDIGATFLAAAGLFAPTDKPLDGIDLLPFLDGRKSGEPHASLFWECNWYDKPDCAARRGQWKIVQLCTGTEGLTAEKWQLFNLSTDLGEANNVAGKHPEIVKELDGAFRDWRSQMMEPWIRKPASHDKVSKREKQRADIKVKSGK